MFYLDLTMNNALVLLHNRTI